jgi:hypothetical protein
MPVYTLKKFEELGHLHIFEGEITQSTPSVKCNSGLVSCCGKIKKAEHALIKNEFFCENDKAALIKCINSRSSICAACEAHLFKKYQEKNRR